MEAVLLLRDRVVLSEEAYAELVLWRLPKPLAGSKHSFKYRLAFVVRGECVLRYDNQAGKGNHRHVGGQEESNDFTTPEQLFADFQTDIARWNDENSDA